MQFTWQNQKFQRIMLKKFLKHHGVSHNLFNVMKHAGDLAVNRQKVLTSVPLKIHDTVQITMPAEKPDPSLAVSNHPIQVMYEDDNWLVVNKQAGLTSVPGPSNRSDTLLNRLKGYLQQQGSDFLRPHLVTRLDRYTSGVVLIAKHRLASCLANDLIEEHALKKKYLAVVSGQIGMLHGQIKMPIGKLPDEIRRHYLKTGKPAWTEYWVLQSTAHWTLVRVQLHTGRTHQIRVHFTEEGHPLLGDHLYAGPMDEGIKRQALHAQQLSFQDPFNQKELVFKAALPSDFQALLSHLRKGL